MSTQIEIEKTSDYRLSHDGYEEYTCDLCNQPNTSEFPHSECSDREQAWADMADDESTF